jgi:hypothetical protein
MAHEGSNVSEVERHGLVLAEERRLQHTSGKEHLQETDVVILKIFSAKKIGGFDS